MAVNRLNLAQWKMDHLNKWVSAGLCPRKHKFPNECAIWPLWSERHKRHHWAQSPIESQGIEASPDENWWEWGVETFSEWSADDDHRGTGAGV